MLPWNAEEDGEADRTCKGGKRLGGEAGSFRIRPDPVQFDDTIEQSTVQHEADAHADGDAEKAQQSVRKACETGEVIGIGQVPDAVHEGDSRNERHDRANDDVSQAVTDSEPIESQA